MTENIFPIVIERTCTSGGKTFEYETAFWNVDEMVSPLGKEMDRVVQLLARGGKIDEYADKAQVLKVNADGKIQETPAQVAAKMSPEQRAIMLAAIEQVNSDEAEVEEEATA